MTQRASSSDTPHKLYVGTLATDQHTLERHATATKKDCSVQMPEPGAPTDNPQSHNEVRSAAGHHHHHDHANQGDAALALAVGINVLLTVAEIVGGVLSGSLALIADALHNLSDAASLALALFARKVSRRPADASRTFGYRRAEVIGALVSVTALLVMAAYLVIEAVTRFLSGQSPITGSIMIWVSLIALAIDIATAALTYVMASSSVNIRTAFLHNVADALGSVATLLVGVVIMVWDVRIADLIATVLIAAYIVYQSISILRFTIHLLLDGAPPGVDVHDVAEAITSITGVASVHHLHARLLDEHLGALEAHIVIAEKDVVFMERIKRDVKAMLALRFDIAHSTLEFEYADDAHPTCCAEAGVIVRH